MGYSPQRKASVMLNDGVVQEYPEESIVLYDMVITKYDLDWRGNKSQLKVMQVHEPLFEIGARRFVRRTKKYRKYVVDDGDGVEVIELDSETKNRLNYFYYEYSRIR